MSLYAKLKQRAAEGRPIRIGSVQLTAKPSAVSGIARPLAAREARHIVTLAPLPLD